MVSLYLLLFLLFVIGRCASGPIFEFILVFPWSAALEKPPTLEGTFLNLSSLLFLEDRDPIEELYLAFVLYD